MVASWRDLTAEVLEDGERLHELAAHVTDEILERLPLGADDELRDATRRSVADNIWLFLSMATSGVPAEQAVPRTLAEEYVRLLVRRGAEADAVATSYRLALTEFWSAWTQLVRERVDPAALVDALDESIRYMLTFVDTLSRHVVEMHERERRAWVRSAEAVRAATIRELLDGAPADLAVAEQRLGYPLDRVHRCVVAWADERAPQRPEASELAALVAERLGAQRQRRTVALVLDPTSVAVWATGTGDDDADLEAVAARGVSLALSRREHAGVDGFRWAFREAMHARRAATVAGRGAGGSGVVAYEDVALQALAGADLDHAQRFVEWQLGPLAADDPQARILADTLHAYLRCESNLRTTAAQLGVHHNTVANRLARAHEALGGAPAANRSAELLVALTLLPQADATA